MSLTSDLLFRTAAPVFQGRVHTHHPDNKPIRAVRESMAEVRRRIRRNHQQINAQILQAIQSGHNTINSMKDHTGLSTTPLRKHLMKLMDENKITRYGKKSTGYFYQEAV